MSEHKHTHACDCGAHETHTHHEHSHDCGCGAHETHTHHEHSPACGGSCCGGCGETRAPIVLQGAQKDFLTTLATQEALPVARFVATGSKSDVISIVMLAPVYLCTLSDDLNTVKETASFLNELAEQGLLALCYAEPLAEYSYLEYEQSALFAYFQQTVREGAEKSPSFLADTAVLERGHIAITPLGTQSLAIS